MIIIVFGLPGSGKSYFSSKLAKKLQAKYVSSDVIRNQLFEVKNYSHEEKLKVYNKMIIEMKKAILQKNKIVLDATFYKKNIRNKFIEAANEFKQKVLFIEVWSDQKTIMKRLSKKRPESDADYAIYLKLKEVFEPLHREHLSLRSTQENIDEMLNKALKYIQNNYG